MKYDEFSYFNEREKKEEAVKVHETSAYKADTELKTDADYEALSEGERVELIDGRFYAMAAPTVGHQAVLIELLLRFRKYIDSKRGNCEVYIAPCDVRLDRDEYTMVQPDLMICCKRDQITYKRIEGAPDLVLEIVSPGSEYLDYHKKLQKYRAAGVREYWIVNPQTEKVVVHHFEKMAQPMEYTFGEQVPVGIYSGDCKIDFRAVWERASEPFRYQNDGDAISDMVREAAAYNAEEQVKTIADYEALPGDERVELIDGKFYAMAAPTSTHQSVLGELHFAFRQYIGGKKGRCKVFLSPCDVRLDRDEYTMVQPDLFICCKQEQITYKRIEGAPDFVLEIVSPSSEYLDLHVKLRKYSHAGVREYWIVNPKTQKVLVYYFEKSDQPAEYTFEDQIPVGIYDGDCKIDFASVWAEASESAAFFKHYFQHI